MRSYMVMATVAAMFASSTVRSEVQYFNSNGVRIAYLDEGRGEALVLLHGFGVSAGEMWMTWRFAPNPVFPAAVREYRVIALDFRGHGESEKLYDPALYGREIGEDVIRLLDYLEVPKAHVVGYSMGASVAGKLLATHPDRLLSVTFGGGGPLFRPSKPFSQAMNATAEALERGDGLGPLLNALTPDGQPKLRQELAALVSKSFLANKDQRALAAVIRGLGDLEVTEAELSGNNVPVSFVYGSREPAWKVELILGSQRVIPKAGVMVIDGGDHLGTVARREFVDAVLHFARAHPE